MANGLMIFCLGAVKDLKAPQARSAKEMLARSGGDTYRRGGPQQGWYAARGWGRRAAGTAWQIIVESCLTPRG
eukprot:2210036-Pleurochrysis_carterae.AAC.3